MPLLLGTAIDSEANRCIQGFVGRVGGSVDQILRYRQCEVEDINLPDGGFEGWSRPQSGLSGIVKKCYHHLKQEAKFLLRGRRVSRDRKTLVLDVHEAHKRLDLRGRFDAVVSSNVLEHSPNPIALLLNFHILCRSEGWQFHAVPHFKYTFDVYRQPTTLDHMVEDFVNGTGPGDETHTADYVRSAVELHGWQREFHKTRPLTYPFIHFHVFNEANAAALFRYVFESVTVDILKTERFSDVVVLGPNRLNSEFVKKHGDLVSRYLNA